MLVLFQGFHSMVFDSINSELEMRGSRWQDPEDGLLYFMAERKLR